MDRDYFQGGTERRDTQLVDWYVGLSAAPSRTTQIVYAGGTEMNTPDAARRSAALGWQIDENNRVDVSACTDGIYNAGCSSANISPRHRYNQSVDVTYNGQHLTAVAMLFQAYYAGCR